MRWAGNIQNQIFNLYLNKYIVYFSSYRFYRWLRLWSSQKSYHGWSKYWWKPWRAVSIYKESYEFQGVFGICQLLRSEKQPAAEFRYCKVTRTVHRDETEVFNSELKLFVFSCRSNPYQSEFWMTPICAQQIKFDLNFITSVRS